MAEEFVIAPHMRLHEWVAVEKGYFDEEGLVYMSWPPKTVPLFVD